MNNGRCTWQERDRWIGLVTSQGCTCANVTAAECQACRDSWTWLDGSAVTINRFGGVEPNLRNERCARLTTTGEWAGSGCTAKFKSICKRGE